MNKKIFVVDTSYLLELFKIGKDWEEIAHHAIMAKFDTEQLNNSQFYFPIPVLFELANHIADAHNKQQAIKSFKDLIDNFLDEDMPFFITPCSNAESIKDFIQDLYLTITRFNNEFATQQLGLTDVSIISEAERLAKKYKLSATVHIWTRHKKLKAKEPHSEQNAFVRELQ